MDFYAYVMTVGKTEKKENKDIVELMLADASKVILPLNFWEETILTIPKDVEKKVLYAFGAFLVNKDGSLHLTPRKNTRLVIATGERPRAKALLDCGWKVLAQKIQMLSA